MKSSQLIELVYAQENKIFDFENSIEFSKIINGFNDKL